MDEISIDRLVLDIPGLNAAQARDLAQRVGTGLAAASTRDDTAFKSADFDALAVDLNDIAGRQGVARLADDIVSALLIHLGGR
ncbi:MAG: hypothetical protein WCA10_07455 [Terracidiphilus sp.]